MSDPNSHSHHTPHVPHGPNPDHPTHHVHETAPLHDPADPWHDHSADERPQEAHGEVGNAPMITGVGVALFLVISAAVVVIYGFYRDYSTEQLNKMEAAAGFVSPGGVPGPALIARQERSNAILYQNSKEPRWITLPAAGEVPAKNIAQLPLAVATEIAIKDYAAVMAPSKPQAGAQTTEENPKP